ncbi:MAG: cytochrome-c peroxidase [Flavobacteriales bacterium]|nr:cytochrome-c peroxidase [Flavobacteriales bacterium]
MKINILYAIPLFTLFSCGSNEEKQAYQAEPATKSTELTALQEEAKSVFGRLPIQADNPENPLNAKKVALGKKLYFETKLSKDNTISCNSCHNIDNGSGVDNLPFSPGNDGSLGGRNSPTTLNAALHMAQFWDGRAKDVEEQAGGPILNPVEMAMPSKEAVITRLKNTNDFYPELFAQAFPYDENPMTYDNLQKAIGAFERTLITPSRVDDFIKGDHDALTGAEKRGLETFMAVGCTSCHAGNAFGGNMYQKFGVYGDYWDYTKSDKMDEGRFEVTKNEADKYVFKVPGLRNVAKTAPYFHDGSVKSLDEAVKIMAKAQLDRTLSDEETKNIVAFLNALSGDVKNY